MKSDRRPIIYHHKLIRDKVVEDILASGYQPVVIQLTRRGLVSALKNKLIEEAREVASCFSETAIAEELADLLQVMYALMDEYGLSLEKVRLIMLEKAERKGVFAKGTYLLYCEDILPRNGQARVDSEAIRSSVDAQLPQTQDDI